MTHKDELAKYGFGVGARFNVQLSEGKIVLSADPAGSRKITDKKGKPVLCVIGKGITAAFGHEQDGKIDLLDASCKKGEIVLTV